MRTISPCVKNSFSLVDLKTHDDYFSTKAFRLCEVKWRKKSPINCLKLEKSFLIKEKIYIIFFLPSKNTTGTKYNLNSYLMTEHRLCSVLIKIATCPLLKSHFIIQGTTTTLQIWHKMQKTL